MVQYKTKTFNRFVYNTQHHVDSDYFTSKKMYVHLKTQSMSSSYCFIFLLRLSIQHERPWLSPVLEKDQSQQSYTTSDHSPVYYEPLDPGGKNVIVLYDISLKKEH